MNTIAKFALAGALLVAPTAAFAGFDGDEGAFFEKSAPTFQSGSETIVAGSFAEKGVVKGSRGHLFNRADTNNDGVLNAQEQRRYKRIVLEHTRGN